MRRWLADNWMWLLLLAVTSLFGVTASYPP